MSDEKTEVTLEVNEDKTTVSDDGNFIDSLPEDLRNDPSLQDFKDLGGLAKSYISAQKMIGGSIRVPGEDASDEAKDEFFGKLESVSGVIRMPGESQKSIDSFRKNMGVPETAADYKFDFPENFNQDADEVENFKAIAHEIGLTPDQARKLTEFEVGKQVDLVANFEDSRVAAEQTLKNSWGTDYDARLAGAKAAAQVYGEKFPEAMEELINGPAGNNPVVLSLLSEMGKTITEGQVAGASGVAQYGVSADEARMQIEEIMENKGHAYHDGNDPNHDKAVSKMHKLYLSAYPE